MNHVKSLTICSAKNISIFFVCSLLLILPVILLQSALAAEIKIAWDAQFHTTGYNVYYRTASGVYGSPIDVGNVTTYTLAGLYRGQRYFIAVTAYNEFGESGYSDELNAVSLTTSVNRAGAGTVIPSGVTWYNSGQSVSVSAEAGLRYTFKGWSGDLSGSINPSSVVMNGPKKVTANFTQNQYTQYTLTISITPAGAGSVTKNPDKATYVHGETVQLTATANLGYSFSSWSGGASGSSDTATITIDGNKNVTANFNRDFPLIGNLENPSDGQKVSGITTIHGWALDGKKVTKVELYVDGTYAVDIPYGGSREDVKDVYPQYPNADMSGFGLIMNYSILSSGNHNILVRLQNQDDQTKDLAATVTVVKFHGGFVTEVVPDSFWFNNVNVTIEGVTKTYDIQVQWSNASQGFEIKEGVLKESSSFNLEKEHYTNPFSQSFPIVSEPLSTLPLIGNLENPSDGQKVSGITTIHGWALDGKKVTKVELYVDGTYAVDIPYGGSREDVKDVYPQYPNADLSGFGLIMNYSILSSGNHNILVRLQNQDDQTKDLAATVTVVKFHGGFVTEVVPDSFWFNNVNVTIEGVTKTYDIQVQWSNASQGFRIIEVVPTSG